MGGCGQEEEEEAGSKAGAHRCKSPLSRFMPRRSLFHAHSLLACRLISPSIATTAQTGLHGTSRIVTTIGRGLDRPSRAVAEAVVEAEEATAETLTGFLAVAGADAEVCIQVSYLLRVPSMLHAAL